MFHLQGLEQPVPDDSTCLLVPHQGFVHNLPQPQHHHKMCRYLVSRMQVRLQGTQAASIGCVPLSYPKLPVKQAGAENAALQVITCHASQTNLLTFASARSAKLHIVSSIACAAYSGSVRVLPLCITRIFGSTSAQMTADAAGLP